MVFLTEFLGAEVIDVHQRNLGRVRDLVVRLEEPYPVVTGLIVRGPDRFIAWSLVRTFAAREVALKATRAEIEAGRPPADEVWLSRDLLDKQIVDTDGRRVVRVNDLQLNESAGQMLLVGADVGVRGLLRRLGAERFAVSLFRLFGRNLPLVIVGWNVVDPVASLEPGALRLRISGKRIAKLHPADIADIVEELGAKDRHAVFDVLTEEVAADTLEEMERDDQVSVIEHMDVERASDILEEMPPDEVADILGDLPQERAKEILGHMEKEEAEDVEALLAYPEDSAGGLMTTEFVAVSDQLNAQQCIATLRRLEPNAESIYYVYVVDADQRLRGVLSLRDLIVARPRTPISQIMITAVVSVAHNATLEEVAAVLSKYNLLALPVVDGEHRLLGIVTVDDALEGVLSESVKRNLPARVF